MATWRSFVRARLGFWTFLCSFQEAELRRVAFGIGGLEMGCRRQSLKMRFCVTALRVKKQLSSQHFVPRASTTLSHYIQSNSGFRASCTMREPVLPSLLAVWPRWSPHIVRWSKRHATRTCEIVHLHAACELIW